MISSGEQEKDPSEALEENMKPEGYPKNNPKTPDDDKFYYPGSDPQE